MTVLSDRSIRDYCYHYNLIEPFEPKQLQPASYDLKLGLMLYDGEEVFRHSIIPREFLLASTVEKVNIPASLVARIEGKSTWARRGLIIHTAGFVDPGFKGQLTLEITNLGREPIPLYNGLLIAQIAFQHLDRTSERPYGSNGLNSHYQGQEGPTVAAASE